MLGHFFIVFTHQEQKNSETILSFPPLKLSASLILFKYKLKHHSCSDLKTKVFPTTPIYLNELLLCSIFISTGAHLPLSLCCLVLELYLPVFSVGICAVMHSEDDGAGQQGSRRPTAHHRGQECLSIFHGWPRRRAEIGISDISIACMYYLFTDILYLKLYNLFLLGNFLGGGEEGW